jgi:hypothetical protein
MTIPNASENLEQQELPLLLVGIQNDTATLKNSCQVLKN